MIHQVTARKCFVDMISLSLKKSPHPKKGCLHPQSLTWNLNLMVSEQDGSMLNFRGVGIWAIPIQKKKQPARSGAGELRSHSFPSVNMDRVNSIMASAGKRELFQSMPVWPAIISNKHDVIIHHMYSLYSYIMNCDCYI